MLVVAISGYETRQSMILYYKLFTKMSTSISLDPNQLPDNELSNLYVNDAIVDMS